MNRKKFSICIIGAGIGGLTAGALLIKKGYSVTIFEKQSCIGGRALSFDSSKISLNEYKDLLSKFHIHIPFSEPSLQHIFEEEMLQGYTLDLGYHAIGGGVFSNLNNVFSELNDHIDVLESRVGFIEETSYVFPFLSGGDRLKIMPNILRLLFASETTMKELDNVSMTESIQRYGKWKMKLILEVFSRTITTVNNLDSISTGETFRSLRNLYRGSKPVGYPKGGLGIIHEKLAQYITKNGGIIHVSSPIQKILIKKKEAIGVLVNGKEHYFDIVISNILVQDLFTIAEKKAFPQEYVQHLLSLEGTGSLCAYYSLRKVDHNLVGKTFHFIERNLGVHGTDAVGMIDFMASSADSKVAPSSQFLVQSYVICTPEEATNGNVLQKLRRVLDKNLEVLIPGFHRDLVWAIYPAVSHLDGVAKTIENVKPEIVTPIANLYLIGDCVKAPGIGVNCALNSARKVCDLISRDQ